MDPISKVDCRWTIGGQHESQFHYPRVSVSEMEVRLAVEWNRPFNAISLSRQGMLDDDVTAVARIAAERAVASEGTVSRLTIFFRGDKAAVFFKDVRSRENRASYNLALVGTPEGKVLYTFRPNSDDFDQHMFHVIG